MSIASNNIVSFPLSSAFQNAVICFVFADSKCLAHTNFFGELGNRIDHLPGLLVRQFEWFILSHQDGLQLFKYEIGPEKYKPTLPNTV